MDEAVFRFKRFSVINGDAGLKVGTDGVLLGAAATLDSALWTDAPLRVLDIGTGTGVIALMMAQRLSDMGKPFEIKAIDIEAKAVEMASRSFAASEWGDNMECLHRSLARYADDLYTASSPDPDAGFDLIVSNPPYFDESLHCPDPCRSGARHTDTLSYREVLSFASDFLAPQGRVSLILPKTEETHLLRFASSFGLFPERVLNIRTTSRKAPSRIVAEFSRCRTAVRREEITIMENGAYTEGYRVLTEGYYLWSQMQ